ncbi:MAG: hypothetical protein SGJ10_11770 [Bacteroidota bacterium]|nr:hypothetical protein [Bacteroidota bacterium]
MKLSVKIISWINITGLASVSITLVSYYFFNPFAWGDWLIAVNLFTSIPFIVAAIISLRNIENPNIKQVQRSLLLLYLTLWFPSVALPFAFELAGLLICLFLLIIGVWGIYKIKDPLNKLYYFNNIGIIFLVINAAFVLGLVFEKTL